VIEATGDDNVQINSASLDNPLVILADQALEFVAIEKQLHVCRATIGTCSSRACSSTYSYSDRTPE
jgi:hypothetical protein